MSHNQNFDHLRLVDTDFGPDTDASCQGLQINVNDIPGMFAFIGTDQCYRFANKQCERLYGVSQSQIVGKHIRELIDQAAFDSIRPKIEDVLAGHPAQFEFRAETQAGRWWMSCSCVPHFVDGNLDGFFAHTTANSDHARTQYELEKEQGLFEGVVQGVPDALMLASLDRTITFCNPGTRQVFGYEPHELIGQSTLVLYDDPQEHRKQGQIRFHPDADKQLAQVEVMMRRKSGQAFPAEMVGTILKTKNGEPLGFLGLIRDITIRKESEAAQQRHYRVLEALSTGTQLNDLLALIIQMAEEARPGMLGSILLLDETKQHLGTAYTTSLPEDFNRAIDGLKIGPTVGSCGTAAFLGKRVIVEEIATHPFWKNYRELAASANLKACWSEPIFSPEDEILGTLAMYFHEPQSPTDRDLDLLRESAQLSGIVIDRARTNDRVRQSEERYRSLVEASSSVVWTTSPHGRFTTPQLAWEKYTGQPWAEHQANGWMRMIHPGDLDRLISSWLESVNQGINYKTHGRMWNAESQQYRYFEAQAVPIRDEGGQIVEWVGTTTDVHERRAADQTLQVNEERLSLAFRATNDAIWDWDLSDNTVWWNEAHQNQFGRPTEPVNYWQWWNDRIYPSDRNRIRLSLDAFAKGEGQTDRWTEEFRFRRDNGSYAHIVDRALRACDEEGRPVRVLGTMLDVSSRRALEKQVLEAATETQRAIGHDLHDGVGQELTGLVMLADSLTEALRRKSLPENQLAEKISVGIERTLEQVRNLARGMNPVEVDPHGLASALIELADHACQLYGIECQFSCSDGLFVNDSETATQLFRIAQEAITNAVKHGHATRIVVELSLFDGVVELKVIDNGCGISEKDLEKGTGMRSMLYRADVIGGTLQIAPRHQYGTIVTCKLPWIHGRNSISSDEELSCESTTDSTP